MKENMSVRADILVSVCFTVRYRKCDIFGSEMCLRHGDLRTREKRVFLLPMPEYFMLHADQLCGTELEILLKPA